MSETTVEALERIADGPYNGFQECKAIARAALPRARREAEVIAAARAFWNTTDDFPLGPFNTTQAGMWDDLWTALDNLEEETR